MTALLDRLLCSPPALLAARTLDHGFTAFARAQGARSRSKSRGGSSGHVQRMARLQGACTRTDERVATVAGPLFRDGRPISLDLRPVRQLADDGSVQDVSWASDYHTLLPEVDERYRRHPENLRGAARLFLHRTRRPAALLLHGYMGGRYALEERMWPVRWLYEAGLDLALFTLPLHGERAISGRRSAPPFPSSDPRLTNEGLLHVLGDLRDLAAWFLERGHPAVGAMGMSLGAYTTALAATVAPELSFAVPMIPLCSLADLARDQGRLGDDLDRAAEEHRALTDVHRIVGPLERQPCLDGSQVMVVAGQADRVTPIAHARRLADHFSAPLEEYPGGHLLQLGRMKAFGRVADMLKRLGLLP